MDRYYYDRPALHAEFKSQHSGFWGTLRKINAVAGTVLGTAVAVKHTADILTGKAPLWSRPYPPYRLHCWNLLPPPRRHFYDGWASSCMRRFNMGIRRWGEHHHRKPPLAMSMARHRHGHSA